MTVKVILTAEEFLRFSLFDTFHRRKMWRSPLIFASIFCFCALICLLMNHVTGAIILGSVLMLVGLGIPISYFGAFFISLSKQIKTIGLPKLVYTLQLRENPDGICVENGQEAANYHWRDIYHIHFGKTAAYLYMSPVRAFILPYSCVDGGSNVLSNFIEKHLTGKQNTFPSQK